MGQSGSWFSRVFSNDSTRGLSGDADRLDLGEGAATFFASAMRSHQADSDLVGRPAQIWDTRRGRRGGLVTHLLSEKGDGTANFTDILVILSEDDYDRAVADPLIDWIHNTQNLLDAALNRYCAEEGLKRLFPGRPFQIRILRDQGPQMAGHGLGLGRGQFVTGLLPNTYTGPISSSKPVIALHVNLPGVWEGYQQIGTLYDDQLLFTIGSHWLDSFQVQALAGPAVYRLQRSPDGTLVHMISPDLQSRFSVETVATEEGPAVLMLLDQGAPVAYLVLAMAEGPARRPTAATQARPKTAARTEREPEILGELPPPDMRTFAAALPPPAPAPPPAQEVRLPAPTPPPAQETVAAEPAKATMPEPEAAPPSKAGPNLPPTGGWKRTVIPDDIDERIFTLKERGALLQRVHFSAFMEGYDVFVAPSGALGTAVIDPAATFHVRGDAVTFAAHSPDVRVDDRSIAPRSRVDLPKEAEIRVGNQVLEYRDISRVSEDGWPYLAEIRRVSSSTYLVFGSRYRIGRDRRCRVRLPDEPHNDNIVWRKELREGDSIRSQTGDIPKSRFYSDSIMVASEHAEIDLVREPVIRCVARHCFTYVRRNEDIVALYPSTQEGAFNNLDLLPGDEILLGNSLFEVAYPPAPGPRMPAFVPATGPFEQGQRAGTAGEKGASSAPLTDSAQASGPPTPVEAPPAAGLGEPGLPPPQPLLGGKHLDSGPGSRPPAAHGPADVTDVPAEPRLFRASFERSSEAGSIPSVAAAEWKVELSRPARLVLSGWMVWGEVLVGNHRDAAVTLPEVRTAQDQRFVRRDYFRLLTRGNRGQVVLIHPTEARLSVRETPLSQTDDLDSAQMEVFRRDLSGEIDFSIHLRLSVDPTLPDPRARLLSVDTTDRLVAGLFVQGLPLKSVRRVRMGPIEAEMLFDGRCAMVSGYLPSYRLANGVFRSFFHLPRDGACRTMPEDGAPVALLPGDALVVESAIHRFEIG
jgi:hypothetical protein